MDKKEIAAILEEMATLLELQGANPFKARAFHNASRAVEGIAGDLKEMAGSGALLEVKGIGKSIAGIIGDLAAKGSSAEHEELRASFPDGVLKMLRIQGLGPKRVRTLYEKLKISTIEQLETAAREGKLLSVEGFGAKTQENILAGIEALRVRSDKHLYEAAERPAHAILADLLRMKGVVRGDIAGSLRRHKEVIGDIDLVLSAKASAREAIMAAFAAHPTVATIVARGDTKSSVVLGAGMSCDLRIVDDDQYPFALNYFTGCKEHNVEMRTRARRLGLSLNEYGFSRAEGGERAPRARVPRCATEADIYKALGLAYVPPELRENLGEFEAAERGALPALIETDDLRGTLHVHSTYSDGVNSIAQLAEAARALGWEYLGIGDHSRSAAYAGGLSEARVREQWREIDALNASSRRFRLLKGTECDILPDGSLDWPERILAGFDYVVASVHSNFKMTEADMTRRIIAALKNKHADMLGHPTGRLLLAREPYAVDMVKVIDAASDYGKSIEINAHPMRLDLDWRLCRYARDKGVMICINPDAHNAAGLRDTFYGVGVARKGWLVKKDVLNTRSADGVEKWLERRA